MLKNKEYIVDKYNPILKKIKDINFAFFDFDGTLGESVGANTYIKRLIKDKKDLDNGHSYKFVIDNNKDYNSIIESNDILLINTLNNKDDLDKINITENEHIKLTTFLSKEQVKEQFNKIEQYVIENKPQITVINNKSIKKYFNSSDFNINLLANDDELKLDISSSNKMFIKKIAINNNRIQIITKIDKKDFKKEMINENIKIMTKKVASYDEIINNKELKWNTIEQFMTFDPVTYNNYKKKHLDLMPDYSDFASAEILRKTTRFFDNVKNEMLELYKNNYITSILTARSKTVGPDGDQETGKEMMIDFFNQNNIPVGHLKDKKIHIFFSSVFEIDRFKDKLLEVFSNIKLNKEDKQFYKKLKEDKVVLSKLAFLDNVLKYGRINELYFYEDNINMLKGAKLYVEKIYPETTLKLKLVFNKGDIIDFDKYLKNEKEKEKKLLSSEQKL